MHGYRKRMQWRDKVVVHEEGGKKNREQPWPKPTEPAADHHCSEKGEQEWIGKEGFQKEHQQVRDPHEKDRQCVVPR